MRIEWFCLHFYILYEEQTTCTSVPSCSRLSGTKYSVTANVGDEEERKEVGSLQETGERGGKQFFRRIGDRKFTPPVLAILTAKRSQNSEPLSTP